MMSLVVNQDTYCTLAEATTYVGANYLTTDTKYTSWTALSDANKEAYLRRATKKIDRQIIKGVKAVQTQTLQFPRAFYIDEGYSRNIGLTIDNVHGEGWYVESAVQQCVKDAQVEEALELLISGNIANKRASLQAQGVKSMSLGSLSESYSGAKITSSLLSLEAKELLSYATGGGVRIC